MSRIGRMPITVPAGVDVTIGENNVVTVKGPKGTLTQAMRPEMIIKHEGNVITVGRPSEDKLHKSLHGLTRSLRHGEQSFGMEQTFALHIIRNRAEHALVAKHGDSVLRHLHGAPLMAGIALQIPRLLLVGDHKRVGFGAAVGFHDLAVVFNRFARRSGNRRNIAADPRLGRAVLHIRIRRFHWSRPSRWPRRYPTSPR